VTLVLVFATFDPARGTDATNPPEGPQDRGSQQKGRLSLQNTGKCVRPGDQELLGGNTAHTLRALGVSPGIGRPPRAVQTLGVARDVQRGALGEERSAPGSDRPESARASRVMKWLGQDLLLSSLGVEGKEGSACHCQRLSSSPRSHCKPYFSIPAGRWEARRVPGAGLRPTPGELLQSWRASPHHQPPKMLDNPELCWRDKMQRELSPWDHCFRKGTGVRKVYLGGAGQVSKRRNGDTTRTVRRLSSTGCLLTHKLQSRSWREAHRSGPVLSSGERKKKRTASLLRSASPDPRCYFGGSCERCGRGVRALMAGAEMH
jgi:hypothetical protein